MKRPILKGGSAVKVDLSPVEKNTTNIADPSRKNKPGITKTAKHLADLYKTTTNGLELFVTVYTSTAIELTGAQRRQLHRHFRRCLK